MSFNVDGAKKWREIKFPHPDDAHELILKMLAN